MDMNIKVPNHIAVILDGNGRWAKLRNRPRVYGHQRGAFNIEKICKYADSLGIKVMSIYCFSTENWNRPEDEVSYLMKLPIRYFTRYKKQIAESNIKVVFSGRVDRVSNKLRMLKEEIEELTKDHTGIILNICFDYGSRDELIRAFKDIAKDIKDDKLSIDDINESLIDNHLDTKGLGDVDLLIRTSGEQRISNYLLWQIAYAELYFTDVYWPEFDEKELDKAILSYSKRNRRFGKVKEEANET